MLQQRCIENDNEEMGRLGKTLVSRLFILFKNSLSYGEGHTALEASAINVLQAVLEILSKSEEASLKIKCGHLYLGEWRLKQGLAGFEASKFLMGKLKSHLIGGISFTKAVSVDELLRFVSVVRDAEADQSQEGLAAILGSMQKSMIINIGVEALLEEKDQAEVDKDKAKNGGIGWGKLPARRLTRLATRVIAEALDDMGSGQNLQLRGAKRAVQHMVDLLVVNEVKLLGMTAMRRGHDTGVQNHAADVCILSLMMGKRFSMTKVQLSALGMAALFHDIGKAEISVETAAKLGDASPKEQQALEMYPVYGVKKIIQEKGLNSVSSKIIAGIFEHRMLEDFSGYPSFPYEKLSLFGRIISIADSYIELTTSTVGGRAPFTHDKAIRFILSQSGKAYDRGLAKLFINCIGVHGVGSLVLLDSKELAVIVGNNADHAQWANPLIRVIADALGREVDSDVMELSSRESPRRIVAIRDPNLFNFDLGSYLL
jgi:HD-GYP domain-containing protein (c-di-GMP phosphodiesterase class II)